MKPTTRDLSDRHEAFVAEGLDGRVTAGSGSTFRDQADVRTQPDRGSFVWSADGKSTLGKSIGVSLAMLHKLVEQSHWARPLLPLRFYLDERLTRAEDWVALRWVDFLELDEAALTLDRVRVLAKAAVEGAIDGSDYEPTWAELGQLILAAVDGRPVDLALVDGHGHQHLLDRLRGL